MHGPEFYREQPKYLRHMPWRANHTPVTALIGCTLVIALLLLVSLLN